MYVCFPARLSLCVITVLAMTTLSYSSQSMVPSVPYVKAVDVYLIISFLFVFGSLLEYAFLLNIRLRCGGQRAHKQQVGSQETNSFVKRWHKIETQGRSTPKT
jgi:ABC-type antimicrobial peptide transport system permease subunit